MEHSAKFYVRQGTTIIGEALHLFSIHTNGILALEKLKRDVISGPKLQNHKSTLFLYKALTRFSYS